MASPSLLRMFPGTTMTNPDRKLGPWRRILGDMPSTDEPSVVPMRRKRWDELERALLSAQDAHSQALGERERIRQAFKVEIERMDAEVERAAAGLIDAQRQIAEAIELLGGRVTFDH